MEKTFVSFLISIISIYVLTGCGDVSPAGQLYFTPIRPDPTSSPTYAASDNIPLSTPTSVVSDQVAVSNFTHSTNRFSINFPENWQFFEQPNGVIFIEPGDQAGYSVVFNDARETYSEEELNQYLVTYVAQNFVAKDSDFSAISQKTHPDGSIVAKFASFDPNLGQVINEVRVKQQGTIVFILLINAVEEQWHVSDRKLQNLADTLTLIDTEPDLQPTPTEEPPIWILIGSTNNQFGFLYPSNWEILRQDEEIVAVALPDFELGFEGSVFNSPGVPEKPIEAAEKAALTFIETLSEEYRDVQNLSPTEFPLDMVSGVTVDFLYTDQDGRKMAGSVITAANEGKIYQIVFTSPAEIYEASLQWFNPMYKSFKILSSEDLLLE